MSLAANTVAGTRHGSREEGLNTIIASTEHGDFGEQKPVCVCGTRKYEE